MRTHLAKHNVFLEMGTEFVSFGQDEEGVTAEVISHKDDKQEKKTIRARYLVDASGAKSMLIPFASTNLC